MSTSAPPPRARRLDLFRRVSRLLAPYRRQMLLLALCTLGTTATSLVTPALIRSAIDNGLGGHDAGALLNAGAAIVGIGLLRFVVNLGKRYLSDWMVHHVGYDLRNALYDKIQRLSFRYHDQTQTGQLMSRCTEDVTAVSRFIGESGMDLLNVTILLAGIVLVLFRESVPLTLLGLIPLAALAFITIHLARTIHPLFYRVDQSLGQVSSTLQENLSGAQVVRAFARQAYEKTKFARANRELYHARVAVVSTWGLYMPTFPLFVMLATAVILWFGGSMVIAGTLTLGELVAFNAYLLLLALPVQQVGFNVNAAGEAAAGARRILEVLDVPQEIQSRPGAPALPPVRGRVDFESVSFSYQANQPILCDITLHAAPDQVIALIGATGSGKTTLINLIPRFYDVTAGAVRIDGHDVRSVELQSLRRQIGIVLQSSLLFSTTLRENIAFGRPEAGLDDVIAAATAARAHEFISALPQGYDTVVGERGVTLSGGQRQRVAIARALLMNPRILILDEATSSVDTQTEYLIQQALAELMRNRTTFVIAQRLTTVKRADQIIVLDDGRIIQTGTHDELVGVAGPYREVYELQLKDQDELRAAAEPIAPVPA